MASSKTIRVVTRASDGSLRIKDFENFDEISELHDQIGIDDCSTDLTIRGMPLFRGLVGPLPESKSIVRYESPDVFEALTKEWTHQKVARRRRRKSTTAAPVSSGNVPSPKLPVSTPSSIPTII
ncbi:MAG: hypothetical protein AB8B55_10715 [Mariniblastus sp.]